MTSPYSGILAICLAALPTSVWAQGLPPSIPAGATRIVNFDRQGARLAVCAATGEPEIQQGARRTLQTAVWAGEEPNLQRLNGGPGACDPVWSPDGRNLALTAQDGLWVFPADAAMSARRVESRPPQGGLGEFSYRAFSAPQWSPDGRLIGVIVSNGGTSWVDVYDMLDGRLFYTSPPETYSFSWGPASNELRIGDSAIQLPFRR